MEIEPIASLRRPDIDKKEDGHWVITGEIVGVEDLVTEERERRMRELIDD